MRILAGRGWWRGRAFAVWVARVACPAPPWPPRVRTRRAAGASWAPDRPYGSAGRKVTAASFPLSPVLEVAGLESEGLPGNAGCHLEAGLTVRAPPRFLHFPPVTGVTLDKSLPA